jgi:hypothetical protein
LQELRANYLPTAKNKPCLNFWMSSGFVCGAEENRFTWRISQIYPPPPGIKIKGLWEVRGDSVHPDEVGLRGNQGVSVPAFTD